MKRGIGIKGQMKLSFGMIFSVILIIVFLAFTGYVIKILLDNQKSGTVYLFKDNMQEDISKIWRNSGSIEREYNLPKSIDFVCFIDYSSSEKGANSEFYNPSRQVREDDTNMFFYPIASGVGLNSAEIKYIDIEKITESKNPFCIGNKDGKVSLIIKKDFNEELVLIENA